MDKEYAKYLLEKTRQDYNLIAQEYARTRTFTWDIGNMGDYIIPGEKVLDFGCGNGRLLKVLDYKSVNYIGVDVSEKLIEIAKREYPETKFQILANPLNLPFPDNYFDKVFCFRTLHHIPSDDFRIKFLREVKRVLKSGGQFILSVWYAWHPGAMNNFLKVIKYGFLRLFALSKLDFKDAFVPWGQKTQRYYHFFTKKELKDLLSNLGFEVKELRIIGRPPRLVKLLKGQSYDIFVVAKKS